MSGADSTAERRWDLVDPGELARVDDLDLVARGVVDGLLIGLHRSPARGFSVEFAENRPYVRGDDLRFVDWKVYARTDRLYVKQYEEETNLQAWLVVDESRSMDWSSDPDRLPSKLRYARMLSASLGLLLLRQGDAPGVLAFDEEVRHRLPARATRAQWWHLLASLSRPAAGGGTRAAGILEELRVRAARRGLVVLVSDLLLDEEPTREALRRLRHDGHEVLVVHVLDPSERELPAAGEAIFFDPETGRERPANSALLRERYRRAVEEAVAEWRAGVASMGAEWLETTTDQPLGAVLRRWLKVRKRPGRAR